MDKSAMFDKALELLAGDMDDMEGSAATAHSMDECPDPLGCTQHEGEQAKNLTPDGGAPSVKIEISKAGPGLPSTQGLSAVDGEAHEGSSEELSPEESEMLKKLLR